MHVPIARSANRVFLLAAFFLFSLTGGCKERPWQLWHSFHARFIDAQGRVYDPTGDQHTTSEAQAYALFFSLTANDRATFYRVLNWTEENLAQGDLATHLPAWLWGKDKNGAWTVLDPNPAADADTWMAYALLEAGRLWNAPAETTTGRAMLAAIAKSEVVELPEFGPFLLPGPAGFEHGNNWILNPSYLPLFIFERFAAVDPEGPWRQIAHKIPDFLARSARHGYAMDWVEYIPGDGFYPAPGPVKEGATPAQPAGSYDAIRVYLWAGMIAPDDPQRLAILNAVPAMSAWLAGHEMPPEKVSDQGIPAETDSPAGFSAAVLPYLRAIPGQTRAYAKQLIRFNALKDAATGLYGKDKAYYDQCLALFANGFLEDRFRIGSTGELTVEWKRQ